MIKIKKFKKGFTLLEILIYISVLAIVFVAVSSFLTWSTKLSAKATAIREATDNTRRAMEIMTYEIRGAKSVYTPTASPSQMSLVTVRYLPAGEISTFIDFYLCGTAICLKKESQDPVAITSDSVEVDNLVFTQISTTTPSIQIQLSVGYKTSSAKLEYQASVDATSTASLRNY